ncbi:hypothetical protein, partial [Acidiphilium sp.]|uniref:hypothetical protein n=2 Tax=Acidiphilium TaxID=522 RepID=UPI0025903DBB
SRRAAGMPGVAAAMVAGEGLALDCPADDKRLIDGFVYRWGFARSCRAPGTMAAIRRGGHGWMLENQ